MHQRSRLDCQGVSTQGEASTRQTTQDRALWRSRPKSGSGHRCLCPPRGAPLWAWLLLGALVVPGAWSFLNEEQEELLVELHNHYRGQVSPSASAMMPLKWDPALKLIAEGYAAKCVWNHNPELEDTGENLFAGTGSLDLREALEKWFLEHLDYDFQNNSCDEDKMCGHYTQMVWADTHRVGCAFHLCNSMDGLDWERVSFLVCNYYPAGNYEGVRPYVEGDWCSGCPENVQKCEDNLCVSDTVEEEVEEDDEEEGTVVPPPATSPTLQPEEDEKVVPPVTTDVQPASTTTPSITTTAVTTKTTAKLTGQDPEDNEAPATPALTTDAAHVPSTTQVSPTPGVPTTTKVPITREVSLTTTLGDEKMVEEKVEEEKTKDGENKQGIAQIIFKDSKSAASVSSPSLLLAGVTGILTLRL